MSDAKETELKEYQKPDIIHELELETRAGSPCHDMPDPFDLDHRCDD